MINLHCAYLVRLIALIFLCTWIKYLYKQGRTMLNWVSLKNVCFGELFYQL